MKAKPQPQTAEPIDEAIPNPPGGGRWKWDAAEKKWLPNEPIEATPQEQE